MGYYTRLLTPSTKSVTLREIFNHLKQNKIKFSSNIKDNDKTVDDVSWNQIEFSYNKEKSPIVLEKNVLNNEEGNLVKSEILEFLGEIERLPLSISKMRVKSKLREIKQIYAFRIPTSDITDEGWALRDWIDNYLTDKLGGFHQADLEGFYLGKKLVLKVK